MSIASNRRDRDADPVHIELVLWDRQAELAAEYLGPGGRLLGLGAAAADGPRRRERVSLEVHGVDLEYDAQAAV